MIYIGEDVLTARVTGTAPREAAAAALHDHNVWEEIVIGMSDISVKFDPAMISPSEAKQKFESAISADSQADIDAPSAIILPARFGADHAPDAALVANALGVTVDALPTWIMAREYEVAMMGFQPGFGYLRDNNPNTLPDISRLDTPRQTVLAGSIGLLGKRACIYALDGPGGWPIVGRITPPLLRRENTAQPFLLSAGQRVKFGNASD